MWTAPRPISCAGRSVRARSSNRSSVLAPAGPGEASLAAPAPARLVKPHQQEAFAPVLFLTLSQIVGYLISIIIVLVIVQFVISLLVAFNVVSMQNQYV